MLSPLNIIRLFRLPIALVAASSAAAAGLVASRSPTAPAGETFIAVLLLACGASALNQAQERDIDALMERTRNRPIPAGYMGLISALFFALLLLTSGAFILFATGRTPLLLGLLTVIWYNGIYTPLKRRTAYAAIIGAFVGAIPPAVGWTAAGGRILDPRLLILSMLIFLWQVPHFWLFLVDRERDYRAAGLPIFTDILPSARLKPVALFWTAATAVVALFLPFYGIIRSAPAAGMLFALVLLMILQSLSSGFGRSKASFFWINIFLASLLIVISLDVLLRRGFQ